MGWSWGTFGSRHLRGPHGPQGAWRADVLATDPAGSWKTALEAQLAPITGADIVARTERMRADNVNSIWFSDRPRPPWLGIVPSVRLERPGAANHLVVAEGLVKFESHSWKPVSTSLAHFLSWAFTHRIGPHTPRAASRYPQRPLLTVWTAPQYITAEDAHLIEEERRQREHETRMAALRVAREKKQVEIRAKNAVSRAKALDQAATAEQVARAARTGRLREVAIRFRPGIDLALTKLADLHGVTATVGFSTGDPRYLRRRAPRRREGRPDCRLRPRPRAGPRQRLQTPGRSRAHLPQPDQPTTLREGYEAYETHADRWLPDRLRRRSAHRQRRIPPSYPVHRAHLHLYRPATRCENPERRVPRRAQRSDGPRCRPLQGSVPGMRQKVRPVVAQDRQHTPQPNTAPEVDSGGSVLTGPRTSYSRLSRHG